MEFIRNILESLYKSVIYDNRYKYILEGLFNTVIIAFFAVIIGIIIGTIISVIRNTSYFTTYDNLLCYI